MNGVDGRRDVGRVWWRGEVEKSQVRMVVFFFFKQETAYEIRLSLVGSGCV